MKHNQRNPNFRFQTSKIKFSKNTKGIITTLPRGTLYMPATHYSQQVDWTKIPELKSMVMFSGYYSCQDLYKAEDYSQIARAIDKGKFV